MSQPKIYVASRASNPQRGAMWRQCRDKGAIITSSWIDATGDADVEFLKALWTNIEKEIEACDRLVLYVEQDDFPLKGAFVEAGMAIGKGKPVFIVAHNVQINPNNFSPLGSWVAHPLVTFVNGLDEVMYSY